MADQDLHNVFITIAAKRGTTLFDWQRQMEEAHQIIVANVGSWAAVQAYESTVGWGPGHACFQVRVTGDELLVIGAQLRDEMWLDLTIGYFVAESVMHS